MLVNPFTGMVLNHRPGGKDHNQMDHGRKENEHGYEDSFNKPGRKTVKVRIGKRTIHVHDTGKNIAQMLKEIEAWHGMRVKTEDASDFSGDTISAYRWLDQRQTKKKK